MYSYVRNWCAPRNDFSFCVSFFQDQLETNQELTTACVLLLGAQEASGPTDQNEHEAATGEMEACVSFPSE